MPWHDAVFLIKTNKSRISFCKNLNVAGGGGHAKRSWLRHCATSQKATSSNPDEVIGISQPLILPATLLSGANSACNRIECQEFFRVGWGLSPASA
jgi:hypothetical protein